MKKWVEGNNVKECAFHLSVAFVRVTFMVIMASTRNERANRMQTWETPDFVEVLVNCECTAYAGVDMAVV